MHNTPQPVCRTLCTERGREFNLGVAAPTERLLSGDGGARVRSERLARPKAADQVPCRRRRRPCRLLVRFHSPARLLDFGLDCDKPASSCPRLCLEQPVWNGTAQGRARSASALQHAGSWRQCRLAMSFLPLAAAWLHLCGFHEVGVTLNRHRLGEQGEFKHHGSRVAAGAEPRR